MNTFPDNPVVLDCEIYPNYFLASFLDVNTGRVRHFETYPDADIDFDRSQLAKMMSRFTTVSFNGNNFDLILIAAAVGGATVETLKTICDAIIVGRKPGWMVAKNFGIRVPTKQWDHVDVIEVAPGSASLKIYGARMNAPKLQDLPFEPGDRLSDEERIAVRDYCINDLKTTATLFESLSSEIKLRYSMSSEYGVDVRSKSDAQIAEAVIKHELNAITGKTYRAPDIPDDQTYRYLDPGIIDFSDPLLQNTFDRILDTRFELASNGAVALPQWLKDTKIEIGSSVYQMGIGGLHSCEKSQFVEREKGYILADFDVASYYPSIILQQRLAPDTLGEPFLKVYQSIVTRRLAAKKRAGELKKKISELKSQLDELVD